MFDVLRDRNIRYGRSFLCFIIVCILLVCTANEKPEVEVLTYADSNNVSLIFSPGNEFYDIVSDEITVYSAIKNIVSEKPVTGRAAGSREPLNYAAICDLFILAGTCVFLFLYFFSDLATSHRFIITYIHNLDGMKP